MFQGVFTYDNGDRYDGEWKDENMEEMHGKGVMSYFNGSRYDGGWKDGRKHGKGVFTYRSGDRFEGEWEDDKRNGKGVYYWNRGKWKGDFYKGVWKEGVKHGKGIYTYRSGSRFLGEYNEGKRYGNGVHLFKNGDMHEGKYLDGKPVDSIKFFSSTGEKGVFEMVGKASGTGKAIIDRNGERIEILYQGSKLIEFVSKEFQDRLEYIQEKCCDFKIPLLNRTLLLCKPFLINSNIQNLHSVSEFRGLSDISLDIEEKIILQIILGFKTTIGTDHLFDYFRFFKRLGLKREMLEILRLLESSPKLNSFKPCFELFVECVKIDENEEIKTWSTSSPKMLEEVSFHNSFSLALFNKMKSFESELTLSSPLMFLPFIGVISFHLKKVVVPDVLIHHDFSNVDMEFNTVEKMFSKLLEEKKMLNLKLLSCDEPPSEVFVHREVLILKSNFFHKMFNFGGRETEELNTTSRVQLEDLGLKEIETLVHCYYSDKVVCSSLETIVLCSVHCHKYLEHWYLSKLLVCFHDQVKKNSEAELLDFLKGTLHKVESEELREILISKIVFLSGGNFDEEKIEKILKKSRKENILRRIVFENRRILEENQLLKEKVENLEEKQKEMEFLMKKMKIVIDSLKVEEGKIVT